MFYSVRIDALVISSRFKITCFRVIIVHNELKNWFAGAKLRKVENNTK